MKLCRIALLAALLTSPLCAQVSDTVQYMMVSPAPRAGDLFGRSLAIAGSLMVVGVPQDDTRASNSGCVYVYDLAGTTPTVPLVKLTNPTPGDDDQFGYSVAILGTRVVVGVYGDDYPGEGVGRVYVYDLNGSLPPTLAYTLNNPTPQAYDHFGKSVAISGTRVVVGAWTDNTGASNAGSAYVYDLSSATPTVPVVTMNNPGPTSNEFFGSDVAISGNRVIVTTPEDHTGAGQAGIIYVYDLNSAPASVPIHTLINPNAGAGHNFGSPMAISGDRLVVGDGVYSAGPMSSGRAYVYDLSTGTPTVPVETLDNPTPASLEYFGRAVAISGTRVVVGAIGESTGAYRSGSAYVYELAGATPAVPVATLNNPSPAVEDYFGYSVAIDGTTVVIGTPNDDPFLVDQGSVYVFGPAPDIQVEAPLGQVRLSGGLALNFGHQPVDGGLVIGVTHRVTNTGPEPLTGLAATVLGPAAADFTLSASPPETLAPGGSFQFDVRFDPTAPGARTVTLSLTSNDPSGIPFLVPLSGTGLTAQEAWRLQYFLFTSNGGIAADTADPDGDGDENLFEFVAGLVPNDPASRFQLRAEPVAEEPGQKAIVFGPVLGGRTYEVKSKASLDDPTWEPLGSFTTSDNGSERTVIDLGAGEGPRFYIVEIVRP